VGLKKDAVDLGQVDVSHAVAHGLEESGEADVAGRAEDALGGADDQGERVLGEGTVSEGDAVELREDEARDVFGREALYDDGVGDAALDVVVHRERQRVQQLGLGEEDEVVVLGEVLEQ